MCMCVCFAALQFSQTLADLETSQTQIAECLTSHTDVVKQVSWLVSLLCVTTAVTVLPDTDSYCTVLWSLV